MPRCTYIILIKDNQENIPGLIDSLKKINDDFRKEFIIVDDGSKDNSLSIIKQLTSDLPRTTIITQNTIGPSGSVNKAIGLVTGDYVQFVEGDEVIHPRSTESLIEASQLMEVDVAFGKVRDYTPKTDYLGLDLYKNYDLIEEPLNNILSYNPPETRNIGKSGSLISRDLLEKIGKVDSSIYTHNISLSLQAAAFSQFVFVESVIAVKTGEEKNRESKFEAYNTIKSIYNFAKAHPEICKELIPLLLRSLGREMDKTSSKANYFMKSLLSRYYSPLSLEQVLDLYKAELDKLF